MAKYKQNFQITSAEDNKTYWIAPTIVTVTAVFCISGNETYILASKRGKGMPNEQHKWNITAGYVDFKDKSMKESASREIYEEIGIKIDPNAIKFVEYKDPDESCANLSLRFCCTIPENYVRDMIKNGSINSDTASRGGEKNEVEDIKLINIRDIDSYEWAFNHKSLIKYLYEKCKIMNKLFS